MSPAEHESADALDHEGLPGDESGPESDVSIPEDESEGNVVDAFESASHDGGADAADESGEEPEGDEGDGDEPESPRERALDSLVALHEDGRDRVEALIFSSEEALDEARIAELLAFPVEQVLECMHHLNDDYAAQGRSFQLRRLAGGWQLVSRPRYADDIRRLLKVSIRQRLSRAALETLAVIAYKQPLTKAEIESIRGVAADGVLKTLLDRHLVTISGRSKGVGKPLLYATTRDFLEYFGLEDLDGMPKLKEIKELMQGRDPGEEGLPIMPLGELLPGPSTAGESSDEPLEPGDNDGFEPEESGLADGGYDEDEGENEPAAWGDDEDTDDDERRDASWDTP